MKARRQQLIRRLVSSRTLHSQHELQELLREEGFEATQATLSRDLAELGVLKGPEGYRLPGGDAVPTSTSRLEQTLRRELLSVMAGGTTVVLKTPVGHGSVLAVELDNARIPGLLGSIAGDDTIFLAATGPAAAKRIASQLARLAGLDGTRPSAAAASTATQNGIGGRTAGRGFIRGSGRNDQERTA